MIAASDTQNVRKYPMNTLKILVVWIDGGCSRLAVRSHETPSYELVHPALDEKNYDPMAYFPFLRVG
jgi:hypothetical protein